MSQAHWTGCEVVRSRLGQWGLGDIPQGWFGSVRTSQGGSESGGFGPRIFLQAGEVELSQEASGRAHPDAQTRAGADWQPRPRHSALAAGMHGQGSLLALGGVPGAGRGLGPRDL